MLCNLVNASLHINECQKGAVFPKDLPSTFSDSSSYFQTQSYLRFNGTYSLCNTSSYANGGAV